MRKVCFAGKDSIMNINDLLNLLSIYQYYVHTLKNPNAFFGGIFPLYRLEDVLLKNAVYIGTIKDLLNLQTEMVNLNIVVVGRRCEVPEEVLSHIDNLIFVENENSGMQEVLHFVARRLALEEDVHETMRILTQALFDNEGAQHILDTAHSILQNPLFVFSVGVFGVNYSVDPEVIANDPALSAALQQINSNKIVSVEDFFNLGFVQNEVLDEIRSLSLVSKTSFNPVLNCNQMTSIIRVRNIEVGFIILLEKNHPFQEVDELYFWRVGEVLSQELQKKTLFTRNRNEVKAQFLNYLLSYGDVPSDTAYQMTRVNKIIKLRDKFYLAVITASPRQKNIDASSFDIIATQLGAKLSNSFYLIRETELVILFNLSNDAKITDYINAEAEQLARTNHLLIGVSNMFRNLGDTKRHYAQAKKAGELGDIYENWVVSYFEDLAPIEALHVIERHDDLLSYCSPQLLELVEHDKENQSDLVTTLYIYLENYGNTTKAAAQLFIHKNTLLYRLAKIKDILNCDLTHGEDIYKMMMGLRILRTLRIITIPQTLMESASIL